MRQVPAGAYFGILNWQPSTVFGRKQGIPDEYAEIPCLHSPIGSPSVSRCKIQPIKKTAHEGFKT